MIVSILLTLSGCDNGESSNPAPVESSANQSLDVDGTTANIEVDAESNDADIRKKCSDGTLRKSDKDCDEDTTSRDDASATPLDGCIDIADACFLNATTVEENEACQNKYDSCAVDLCDTELSDCFDADGDCDTLQFECIVIPCEDVVTNCEDAGYDNCGDWGAWCQWYTCYDLYEKCDDKELSREQCAAIGQTCGF